MNIKKIPQKSILAGVLSGFAYHFKMPTWLVRFLFIVALFMSFGLSVFVYIVLAFLMPKWEDLPIDYTDICE